MDREAKARVIIQGASLQGIHFDELFPKLAKLGYDEEEAKRLMDEYSMRTDIAFKPGIAHKVIGLILLAAGVLLIAGTTVYLLTTG